jgi:NAD+ synthase
MELLFDWESAIKDIVHAIRWHFQNTGAEHGVIGLSGGVDSSVTTSLAVRALGANHVKALILPENGVTTKEDLEDAVSVATLLGIVPETIKINPAVESFVRLVPELVVKDSEGKLRNPIAYANIKARIRMILLYAYANILREAQVIGTGDKSELLIGYSTKYGDHGVDLLPLGDLYKTQVRFLAEKLGLPERVWRKRPSPRLLPDQFAETEIGLEYELIDRILYYRVEERHSEPKIAEELGIPLDTVKRISRMIVQSHHKRKPPPICKIGSATINWDWRMPTE